MSLLIVICHLMMSREMHGTYVNEQGLMTGLDANNFGPTQELARVQFATILYRMEGETEVEYSNKFPDVGAGIWYLVSGIQIQFSERVKLCIIKGQTLKIWKIVFQF